MPPRIVVASVAAALALAGCGQSEPAEPNAQAGSAQSGPAQSGTTQSATTQPGTTQPGPTARASVAPAAAPAPLEAGVTPMPQRVAVLGLLNKRNGIVRNIQLRPGQSVRVRDAIVRLRACESTAPWENEKLTGAFVQLDVERTDGRWQRMFSGWLYKEAPSLNVVEHPVYDVWPRSCAMSFPAGAAPPDAPASTSNASSANRSGSGARPRSRPVAADSSDT
jgi:hypothetical protein